MKRLLFVILSIVTLFFTFNVYAADNRPAADDGSQSAPHFEIKSFQIEGHSRLDRAEMDATLARYTGADKDFSTIRKAMEALEAKYHRRGYTAVQVILPEQELKDGIVRLVIIEKSIRSVKIEGNKYFDEQNIRKSIPALREGELPNFDKISTELKLANEHPAKKINLLLKPGEKESDIDANLKVEDEKA